MYTFKVGVILVMFFSLGKCDEDDPIRYVISSGAENYSGKQSLASLDRSNAELFVNGMLGSRVTNPDYSFSAKGHDQEGITLTDNDFLRSQEKLIKAVRAQALLSQQMKQKTIRQSEQCEAGGTIEMQGNLTSNVSKSKINLVFRNCRYGGSTFNGAGALIIYNFNAEHDQPASSSLSYNRTTVTSGNASFVAIGNIAEVHDFNASTIRTIADIQMRDSTTGKESLIKATRFCYCATHDAYGEISLQDYGKAKFTNTKALVYAEEGNIPTAGEITFTGANDSKIKVTALGEVFDSSTQTNKLMLEVSIDANGDGVYESTL